MRDNNQKKQIQDLEAAIQRKLDYRALQNYLPRSFHWEFMTSPHKTRMMIAANQIGKTSAAAHIVIDHCLGYRTWIKKFYQYVKAKKPKFPDPGYWFEDQGLPPEEILKFERIGLRTPLKVAVIAIDFESAIIEKILEIIPRPHKDGPFITKIDKAQGRIIKKIHWQNGSTITFFSQNQEDFHYEGGTWDLIIFDEPPKQEHYVAMARGAIVKGAHKLFSMTPLSEPWIFDTLHVEAALEDSDILEINVDLYSEEVDWMSKEDKDEFALRVRQKNPHEVEARVHGRFYHIMGRIFSMYDTDIHRLSDAKIEKKIGNTYGMTVDPHDRKPFMITWWMVDPHDNVTFIDEWPKQLFHEMRSCDETVETYCDIIRDIESRLPDAVTYRFIDPNSGPRRYALTGQSFVDAFAEHGFFFEHEINDGIEYGHGVIREYLSYDTDKKISVTNTPKVFFSEECMNIDYALQRYAWDDKRRVQGLSEKPQEKYKDPVDCIRYTLVKRPIWLSPDNSFIQKPPEEPRVY